MSFTDGFYENYEGMINLLIEKGVFADRDIALGSILYSFFRIWDELGMDADKVKELDPTSEMPMPIDDTRWIHGIIYTFRSSCQFEALWDANHTTPKYDAQISSLDVVEGVASKDSMDLDARLQGLIDDGIFSDIHTEVESILMCAVILLSLTGLSKDTLSTEYDDKFPIKNLDDVEYYVSGLMDSTMIETKYDNTMQKMGYPVKYNVTNGTISSLPSKVTLPIKKKFP